VTHEEFRRVRALFAALRAAPHTEWIARLEREAPNDAQLRDHVLELLRRSAADTATVASAPGAPAGDGAAAGEGPNAALPEGTRIGPYRLRAMLGVGGMGAVYEAEHERSGQRAALKLAPTALATPAMLRRFEFELTVLARLSHPGIARIYHADTLETPDGPRPYFAMELVRGRDLVQFAAERGFSVAQKIGLMCRIADAVQYAHQQGVIHRDLKPANIMVDEDGQPKILDFGIARATDADVHCTTWQTDVGQLVGTLAYMSPEQAAGDPTQIDTRSDVYALGVVTYELLTGRLPYVVHRRMVHEVVRIIREEEPTRLSSLNRALGGDIETIVGKALEKDKTRRYQSAAELAADMRRYLQHEPIAARPPSAAYQLSKFARRNKTLVGGVAASFVILAAGVIGTGWMAWREASARSALETLTEGLLVSMRVVDPAMSRGRTLREMIVNDLVPEIERRLQELPPSAAPLRARLRLELARTAWRARDPEYAIRLCDAAIDYYRSRGNGALQDLWQAQSDKAAFLSALRRHDEALAEIDSLLDPLRRTLGDTDARVLRARQTRATVLVDLSRFDEADAALREVEAQQRTRAAEIPALERAATLHELGRVSHFRGDVEASRRFAEEAIASAAQEVGDVHPDVLVMRRALLYYTGNQGALAAPPAARSALVDDEERVFGEVSVLTLVTQASVALYDKADFESALTLADRAIRRIEEEDDDDHYYPWACETAGQALWRLERADEAADRWQRAVDFLRRRGELGTGHGITVLNNLANCLAVTGQHERAIPIHEELIALKRAAGRDRDTVFIVNTNNLGRMLVLRRDGAAAEPHYRASLALARELRGAEHWEALRAQLGIVNALQLQRRFADAEAELFEFAEACARTEDGRKRYADEIIKVAGQLYAEWAAGEGSDLPPDAADVRIAGLRARLDQADAAGTSGEKPATGE